MTKAQLNALRHPSEQSRFWITLLVIVPVILVAIAAAFSTVATLTVIVAVVAVVVIGTWFSSRLVMARFLGGFVQVSNENFPEVAAAIEEFQTLFGYKGQIDAYVYEDGSFNAFLVPLLRRKVLLLNSEVVAAAKSENEVRWVVARFIGSLASKHYRFLWLQVVLTSIEKLFIFNMLLYPYERAVVQSGDQLGLHAIGGDVESAIRASYRMMVGGQLGERVNLAGVLGQHGALDGSFFGWLARCLSPFPHQTTRIVNLLRFANERYPLQLQQALADKDEQTLRLVARSIHEEPRGTPGRETAAQAA